MSQTECINIFNSALNDIAVDINQLLSLVSNYLVDTGSDKVQETISFLSENPQMLQNIYETVRDYYLKKYSINTISLNNKILCYVPN